MRRTQRYLLLLAAALTLAACDPARVVDCRPGEFVRADGEAWCVFDSFATTNCPETLPEEHRLPWGGRGCAEEQHQPLPIALCVAVGECGADAGPGAMADGG